jgi:hypothetical protein
MKRFVGPSYPPLGYVNACWAKATVARNEKIAIWSIALIKSSGGRREAGTIIYVWKRPGYAVPQLLRFERKVYAFL